LNYTRIGRAFYSTMRVSPVACARVGCTYEQPV